MKSVMFAKPLVWCVVSALTLSAVPSDAAEGDRGSTPIPKDPLIAGYLSATMPGLGQIYTGRKGRGFLIMAGMLGTLGTAAALYEPARLELSDYDRTDYGGNGDGVLSVTEVTNWEEGEYEDDAFTALSGGRKAGIIIAGAAGLGLYIWNIIDARSLARDHNRERGFSLGPAIVPGGAGAAVALRF